MAEVATSQLSTVTPVAPATGPKTYLFFGPGGTGKTTAAAKHKGKKKLWIDVDDKIGELENLTLEQKSRIQVWRCDEPLSMGQVTYTHVDRERKNVSVGFDPQTREPQGYHKIMRVVNELLAIKYKGGEFPYDAVVLDSLSRTSDHLVALTMWTHKVTLMTETLWGVVSGNLTNFITGFLRLPVDRIIIAHDKKNEIRDREGNILAQNIRPLVVGQMADRLNQYFSETYYFNGRNRDGKYTIQTVADKLLPARTSKNLKPEDDVDNIFK